MIVASVPLSHAIESGTVGQHLSRESVANVLAGYAIAVMIRIVVVQAVQAHRHAGREPGHGRRLGRDVDRIIL